MGAAWYVCCLVEYSLYRCGGCACCAAGGILVLLLFLLCVLRRKLFRCWRAGGKHQKQIDDPEAGLRSVAGHSCVTIESWSRPEGHVGHIWCLLLP